MVKRKKKKKAQTMIYNTLNTKTKDRAKRTPLKTGGELRCSGRVGSSCSTSGTRRVNLVINPVISREWGKEIHDAASLQLQTFKIRNSLFINNIRNMKTALLPLIMKTLNNSIFTKMFISNTNKSVSQSEIMMLCFLQPKKLWSAFKDKIHIYLDHLNIWYKTPSYRLLSWWLADHLLQAHIPWFYH